MDHDPGLYIFKYGPACTVYTYYILMLFCVCTCIRVLRVRRTRDTAHLLCILHDVYVVVNRAAVTLHIIIICIE